MRSRNLSSIFAAVLAASSFAAACGGSVGSPPSNTPSETDAGGDGSAPTTPTTPSVPYTSPFACDPRELAYDAVRQAMGADYLELKAGPRAELSVGEPCVGLADADAAACKTKIAEASSEQALFTRGQDGMNRYLVVAKGSDVLVVASRDAMLAVLGPIDSAAKAWLVALQQNYVATCETGWIAEVDGGWVLRTVLMISDCPMQYADVALRVEKDGTVRELERKVREETSGCAGRRPEGLARPSPSNASSEVGRHLAMIAHLEAASVHAFRVVREELVHHGAPSALVTAASRALRDEVRHAAVMKRLAHRYGAEVPPVHVEERPLRSLEAMALENAREGCVRELYGALEATWQAEAAEDVEVARAMRRIARDETRHAELSLAIADWLAGQLDEQANARVAEASRAAFVELEGELAARRGAMLTKLAGVPSAEQACLLVRHLEQALAA